MIWTKKAPVVPGWNMDEYTILCGRLLWGPSYGRTPAIYLTLCMRIEFKRVFWKFWWRTDR